MYGAGLVYGRFPCGLFVAVLATTLACSERPAPPPPDVSVRVSVTRTDTLPTSPLTWTFRSTIRSIFQDSRGHYWFGSDREGVCRYDGTSFHYYTRADGLVHDQIRTIQEDAKGNVWFATGNGVSVYDGRQFTTRTATNLTVLERRLSYAWAKQPGDLWFNGEREGGIYRYDGENLVVLPLPDSDPEGHSFGIQGTVTAIAKGRNNRLWIASYGGVIGYDGASFTFINEAGIDYHVRSLYEDRRGVLWIGNNGIGVLRYDGDTTINFTQRRGVNDTFVRGGSKSAAGTLNHVFAIAEDRHGHVWFGDRDTGAWRYDGKQLTNYTTEDGLPNNFVRTIYRDRAGLLWFGLEGGSVVTFDGATFRTFAERAAPLLLPTH